MTDSKRVFTVIPAAPGWSVAEFGEGDSGEDRFFYEPIIAWDIESSERRHDREYRSQLVTPITINGDPPMHARWLIRRPDGKLAQLEGRTYDGEAAALKGMRADLERDKQPAS
jgi:hypothetical protein